MKESGDKITQLLTSDLEKLLESAACQGARKALREVGLADEQAANDIRRLRDLSASIKLAQKTFLKTLVRWLTIGLLALLLAGAAGKLDLINWK